MSQMMTQVAEDEEESPSPPIEEITPAGPPPPPPVWGKLLPLLPGLTVHTLQKDVVKVGRSSSADVIIRDSKISSLHCEIKVDAATGEVFITDRSVNGTWLNDVKLVKNTARLLSHADQLTLAVGPNSKASPVANFFFQLPPSSLGSSLAADPVDAKYRVGKVVGTGACGHVRLATNRATGEHVAIKVIEKKKMQGERERQRKMIQQESDMLRKCNHPNITRCFDVIDTPTAVYIVMEYVGGGELLARLIRDGAFAEAQARQIAFRILDAVDYLHTRLGIVHRDLKPENILLADEEDSLSIKITDFGLAKLAGDDGLRTYCGTPQYFAPEVLQRRDTVAGVGRYGKAADMWSIGVIVYILLSGIPPFKQDRLFEQVRARVCVCRATCVCVCVRARGESRSVHRPSHLPLPLIASASASLSLLQIQAAEFNFDGPRWTHVTEPAKDLVRRMLTADPKRRIDVRAALSHPWLRSLQVAATDAAAAAAGGSASASASASASGAASVEAIPSSSSSSSAAATASLEANESTTTTNTEDASSSNAQSSRRAGNVAETPSPDSDERGRSRRVRVEESPSPTSQSQSQSQNNLSVLYSNGKGVQAGGVAAGGSGSGGSGGGAAAAESVGGGGGSGTALETADQRTSSGSTSAAMAELGASGEEGRKRRQVQAELNLVAPDRKRVALAVDVQVRVPETQDSCGSDHGSGEQ
jgi:serine/threonine protein kinase